MPRHQRGKLMRRKPAMAIQRGVALMTALLILALASLLAYGLLERGALNFERAQHARASAQARALADGLFDYALINLRRDADETQLDHFGEPWAQPLPPLPVPQGSVSGQLFELNGRINVNGFAAERADRRAFTRKVLTQLLTNLELDPSLAARIEDAIDLDDVNLGSGEDVDYLSLRPARRAPNRPLAQLGELLWVPRLSAQDFATLAPFLTAIDPNASLNINTASIPVLMSLDPAISETVAKTMYQDGQAAYRDVSEFVSILSNSGGPQNLANVEAFLSVRSTHFLASARVKLAEQEFRYQAEIDRENEVVLWRLQSNF
jgi:general secretion pathway protein K